jgi:hypothetical protein
MRSFNRRRYGIVRKVVAAIFLLVHEPDCIRVTPHQRRFDFAGALGAIW